MISAFGYIILITFSWWLCGNTAYYMVKGIDSENLVPEKKTEWADAFKRDEDYKWCVGFGPAALMACVVVSVGKSFMDYFFGEE
jgi:hypothetical protein